MTERVGQPRATPTSPPTAEAVESEVRKPWEGLLVAPSGGSRCGVLVLAGSSGRIERVRARLFAQQGVTALALRWFGGQGQPPGICEVPLETFTAGIDLLRAEGAERVSVLGTSKGAEAALLIAAVDQRVDAVIAFSATSVVWGNVGPGVDGDSRPYRSSWTWRSRPWPFVPYDDAWQATEPEGAPVAIRGWYELSRRTFADRIRAAEIPVATTDAEVLLIAGGDDGMWPSLSFAHEVAARRTAAGLPTRLISRDDAGHRPRLPGEGPAPDSQYFLYGGTPAADAAVGAQAWPQILNLLHGAWPVPATRAPAVQQ